MKTLCASVSKLFLWLELFTRLYMFEIRRNSGKRKSDLWNCSTSSVLHKAGYILDIHCDCTGHIIVRYYSWAIAVRHIGYWTNFHCSNTGINFFISTQVSCFLRHICSALGSCNHSSRVTALGFVCDVNSKRMELWYGVGTVLKRPASIL